MRTAIRDDGAVGNNIEDDIEYFDFDFDYNLVVCLYLYYFSSATPHSKFVFLLAAGTIVFRPIPVHLLVRSMLL